MPLFAARAPRIAALGIALLAVGTAAPAVATSAGTDHVLPTAAPASTGPHRVCGPASPGWRTCFAIAMPPTRTMTPNVATADPSALRGPAGGLTPTALATAYHVNANAATTQLVAIVDAYNDARIWWELNAFDVKYGLPTETTESFARVD